jgi:hypothetical protein
VKYRFFSIPVQDASAAEEELNRFLSGHRVVSVDKEFAADGRHSLWCFCISYIDDDPQAAAQRRSKVDYREVLDELGR